MRDSTHSVDDIEQPTSYVDSNDDIPAVGAKTGAVATTDPQLAAIISAWPSLSKSERSAIFDLMSGCGPTIS